MIIKDHRMSWITLSCSLTSEIWNPSLREVRLLTKDHNKKMTAPGLGPKPLTTSSMTLPLQEVAAWLPGMESAWSAFSFSPRDILAKRELDFSNLPELHHSSSSLRVHQLCPWVCSGLSLNEVMGISTEWVGWPFLHSTSSKFFLHHKALPNEVFLTSSHPSTPRLPHGMNSSFSRISQQLRWPTWNANIFFGS